MKQLPVDSIWGRVRSASDIAPQVYLVSASEPDKDGSPGPENSGLMIPLDLARQFLPEAALPHGIIAEQTLICYGGAQKPEFLRQDFIHYIRDKEMLIPLYELLRRRLITSYGIIRHTSERLLLEEAGFCSRTISGSFPFQNGSGDRSRPITRFSTVFGPYSSVAITPWWSIGWQLLMISPMPLFSLAGKNKSICCLWVIPAQFPCLN